jgi:exosortase
MSPFFIGLALLLGAFGPTLVAWVNCALGDELHSHVLLIPLLGLWLAWRTPAPPPTAASRPAPTLPALLTALGLILVLLPTALGESGFAVSALDQLAARMLALVALLAAWCGFALGRARLRSLAFPLGLLIFAVPLPAAARTIAETALQHGSATVAATLLELARVPVYADGLNLQLPWVTLAVAPECSGLRSSLALLITTLVVGHLMLRQPRHLALLTLAIAPLSLLRNGLRIFALGALSGRWGNGVLASPVHQHAGPVLFAASLLPMGCLLLWLHRREQRASNPTAP